MSFSFGFTGEDYDDISIVGQPVRPSNGIASTAVAKSWSLEELMKFLPLTLAYGTVSGLDIPRRELWDLKHQLMAEHDTVEEEDALRYLGSDDVIAGLYEGGFKTWECSVDLARLLQTQTPVQTILELGCGSALPALTLLKTGGTRIVLQDYNEAVLRYLTLPNVLLAWAACRSGGNWQSDGELNVTDEIKSAFASEMGGRLEFLSGGWSSYMSSLVGKVDLILASETIYNEASLAAFCSMLEECLAVPHGQALVAAKKMYFGVGGGIQSFKGVLTDHPLDCQTIYEANEGVRRAILKITRRM
ncbi:Histidine protein methyltransferase 1 [Savitreella phatthalungensis]